ncbi:Fructoselysine kinase [Ensifer psoraleae]|uniref:PfkB family carbohydrate kinase n=1 Tax=Sinorhizobium psoraleae TaxID=520838 RepID=UPI00156A7026|nr:PfkB family carbohydrate kinase [Sinorhizobium psoraleae]NRP72869.1 Fructoselysine kinase [Sinorhizobium psoraleae]
MKSLRFATVGDNCIDRFQPPLSQSLVGGNAVNVAVQLARKGHIAHYFGAVGRDADGVRTRRLLQSNGVALDYLQERSGITAYTNIDVLPSGERIISYEDFGVCAGYAPDDAEVAVLKTFDHVHIGWINDGGALRRRLVAEGVSLSQDVSVNAAPDDLGVAGLAIAFASAGPDEAAAERMAAELLAQGARIAVVTRGSNGSMATDGIIRAEAGIRPVAVVDTTGAGDSFIAAFLAAHLAGKPLSACLADGRDWAAETCTHVGGFPQEPLPF